MKSPSRVSSRKSSMRAVTVIVASAVRSTATACSIGQKLNRFTAAKFCPNPNARCLARDNPSGFYKEDHAAPLSVPVTIPSWDDVRERNDCGSSGKIKVDTFAAVRDGPGVGYREIDRVFDGQRLVICDDQHNHNGWWPVIYIPDGEAYENNKCFGTDHVTRLPAHPYRGPCRSGWINKNLVTDIAG
jgi:hypothetical protein